jgi:LysM repeat protein
LFVGLIIWGNKLVNLPPSLKENLICSHMSFNRYNCCMQKRILIRFFLFISSLIGFLNPSTFALDIQPPVALAQSSEVSAFDLIIAMNTLRVSNGLPALIEDPIVNAVAQSTAEIMAANQMSWHIGDVRGRLAAAGYGGGATVWATENFAVGTSLGIDEIMLMWSDATHMIPAVNPAYCHIGAGVARADNGSTYFVLQAAYTSAHACGEYKSVIGTPLPGSSDDGTQSGISQYVIPVKIATPDSEGKIFHVVEPGQSFWSIAIAYKITIKDIEIWNNISRESKLQIGQRLFIPGSNTEGYFTPTPVGMVLVSTPDRDGKIIHTVEAYQTLSTISQAYKITIDRILTLNGIQVEWPLQIGQKLLINPGIVTPSPTPRPLTAIEKLTPASDGKYYHIVHSGENLSWIANYYDISVTNLMTWNGLNASSILLPEQKLILHVTPPATGTPTPDPATSTQAATPSPRLSTPSLSPTQTITPSATAEASNSTREGTSLFWLLPVALIASGLVLMVILYRRRA